MKPFVGRLEVRPTNHGYETPKQALETYSVEELRGTSLPGYLAGRRFMDRRSPNAK